jgi:AraC-like DNA-binding protein
MDSLRPPLPGLAKSQLGDSPSSPFSKQTFIQPSRVARRLLWHVFSAGTVHIREPDHHEPFEKPGVHLFWIVSGHGELRTKSGRFSLAPGNHLWVVDMMEPRTYISTPGKRLLISGMRIGGIGLESWLEELGATRQAKFQLDELQTVRNSQRKILALAAARSLDWEWQIHLHVTNILGTLLSARRLLLRENVQLPAPVVCVLNAISAAPCVDWKVKDLARIAGVSYSTLRALFTMSQRESLHSYLLRTRMDHARLLLSDPRLAIKQIADHLNFSSEFYFSHFFKRFAGVSPSAFREQLKIKK